MKFLQARIYTIAIVVLVDAYLAEQGFVWLIYVRIVFKKP
jgi:adenosylcobinamide amidohydrolase